MNGKSLVHTVVIEAGICRYIYAILKMCENSDQEDKPSNFPTMHKTIYYKVSDSQPF